MVSFHQQIGFFLLICTLLGVESKERSNAMNRLHQVASPTRHGGAVTAVTKSFDDFRAVIAGMIQWADDHHNTLQRDNILLAKIGTNMQQGTQQVQMLIHHFSFFPPLQ